MTNLASAWLVFEVTEAFLRDLALNERQIKAVFFVKEKEKITNQEYQQLTDSQARVASLDFYHLDIAQRLPSCCGFQHHGIPDYNATLISRNRQDFKKVPGLTVEYWD